MGILNCYTIICIGPCDLNIILNYGTYINCGIKGMVEELQY